MNYAELTLACYIFTGPGRLLFDCSLFRPLHRCTEAMASCVQPLEIRQPRQSEQEKLHGAPLVFVIVGWRRDESQSATPSRPARHLLTAFLIGSAAAGVATWPMTSRDTRAGSPQPRPPLTVLSCSVNAVITAHWCGLPAELRKFLSFKTQQVVM